MATHEQQGGRRPIRGPISTSDGDDRTIAVPLDAVEYARLQREADRAGISVEDMAERLVEHALSAMAHGAIAPGRRVTD